MALSIDLCFGVVFVVVVVCLFVLFVLGSFSFSLSSFWLGVTVLCHAKHS